ncbi:ComF family protein [Mangrovimonas xylaniphaga]|uniref:ComF family protein n=1 Tax=Mangrovimonas xylaniphaga TaxID=1645915 RepID=UPI0006B63E98|nr:ComF family protein [Mangrovimonas xylaniphaga]
MKNLLNLFFPKVCMGCNDHLGDNEACICLECRHQLPLTNFHFDGDERVKNVLYGRVPLQQATSLLHFSKKGIVQQILHNLKYRGQEEVGTFLGKWLGEELKSLEAYQNIDLVVPVPIHKAKMRKRGFNQVHKFGQEIATALQIPFNTEVLQKQAPTNTQVFKDRLRRLETDTSTFKIAGKHKLTGKHLLLVDDIITTGATVEACAQVLLNIEGVSLSLATMAITD